MFDIITIGSATIDVFLKTHREIRNHGNHKDICYHLGDKVLVDKINIFTGGGGTNTAVAFSRLGLKTGFLGALGQDINAKIILDDLKKEGVSFLGFKKKGNTGYSVVLPSNEDRTILTFKGNNDNLELKDIDFDRIRCKWLYISTMMGKSFETIVNISNYAKKNNIRIALNISNYLAKKGLKNLTGLLRNIDIIILNKVELELLTNKLSINESIKKLLSCVKGIIVITDGHRPINAFDEKRRYIKKIKALRIVNTTGAGDAFAAGFVYGIIKDKNIMESLGFGHKEACSVLMHKGAKTGLLRKLQ
ncbi:carbohydrate kinase family protein [Candidatus Pacearchaeota archaeon]|nr:carbohydrate kinase family protein [Candidatus Pacearchaeota archaeon]